ncbi:uncharacterized protein LOC120273903 [Dioscorea cayenensis subsp. rotundata]|uniref:Uncharacterized protein LOC120273903 n=1 Tax=Dioscorea cayennensis subsp. rotundata TaxID=55577 RepID=A0AB40CE63_DIOCR|nr:uncharacterized protein LOC120273903 [Dioscorea cayenensis subsp. rotundata]
MAAQSPVIPATAAADDHSVDPPSAEHSKKREKEKYEDEEEERNHDAEPREKKRRRTCPAALTSISATAVASAVAVEGSGEASASSFSFDPKGIAVAPIETTPKFGSFYCGVDLGLELGKIEKEKGRDVDVIKEKGEGKLGNEKLE